MSLVDVLILVVLVVFLLKGVIQGLLKEVCSLLGLLLGGVFAFTFHQSLAQSLRESFALTAQQSTWGAFLAIFLSIVAIFSVLGFVLHRFIGITFLGGVNRLAGALFGLVQGVVLLSMLVLALNSSVVPQRAQEMLRDSQLAPPFVGLGKSLYTTCRELLGG